MDNSRDMAARQETSNVPPLVTLTVVPEHALLVS